MQLEVFVGEEYVCYQCYCNCYTYIAVVLAVLNIINNSTIFGCGYLLKLLF